MQLQPGSEIGPFRIVEQVGKGGMAVVYKAYQAALARYVAIKVLPSELSQDPGFQARFRDEAIAVAGLRHANIMGIFDYGQQDGITYLVTEFIDGGTLDQQMGTPLPLAYVCDTLAPIASALDYAHARGVIHRDIKPSNILMAHDGRPILGDFGLARMMTPDRDVTSAGMILGTPQYMAPEQSRGNPVPQSDTYSLGIVAYHMLTGRVPFSADTPMAVILAHQSAPLPPPRSIIPSLPEAAEAALLKALAREPEDRQRTTGDFVQMLSQARSAAPAYVPPVAPPTPPAPPKDDRTMAGRHEGGGGGSRRGLVIGLIALLVVLLGGGAGGWYLMQPRNTVAPVPPAPVASQEQAWEQWKKLEAVVDLQPTSKAGTMLAAANGKWFMVKTDGTVTPFAEKAYSVDPGGEAYIEVSPGLRLKSGCEFGTDQSFALKLSTPVGVTHITPEGTLFGELVKLPSFPSPGGIAFDTAGRFGNRLLITGLNQDNTSSVASIECDGKFTVLTTRGPRVEGGMEVAPPSFGEFAGQLIAPDEWDGKVFAIDEKGSSRLVADSGLPTGGDVGIESLGFVPPGFIAGSGAAYVADRVAAGNPHPGTDTILRLTAAQMRAAGVKDGDLIAVNEGGGDTIAIRCATGCTVTKIAHATTGAHVEGHVIFMPA
ncbi:MAG: eukaryotic-like serine/threonine-protein kinase [Chloroflexota bacterium]|jgi:predicted Ser/Thr protein kinase|nr:eukaryotic-like serine/threonine-protein kinase [Chloroflexota bacterium]